MPIEHATRSGLLAIWTDVAWLHHRLILLLPIHINLIEISFQTLLSL